MLTKQQFTNILDEHDMECVLENMSVKHLVEGNTHRIFLAVGPIDIAPEGEVFDIVRFTKNQFSDYYREATAAKSIYETYLADYRREFVISSMPSELWKASVKAETVGDLQDLIAALPREQKLTHPVFLQLVDPVGGQPSLNIDEEE